MRAAGHGSGVGPCRVETFPGRRERLRHHAGIRDRGHEVRVADPTGNDMDVQVLGDGASGGAPHVDAVLECRQPQLG